MEAKASWKDAVSFSTTSGTGHTVVTDGPADSGGLNRGPRPMELLLMGTGACAAYDVLLILQKGRQRVTNCDAHVKAERADDVPSVFTTLHIHFTVSGEDLSERKVARAVDLSADKYCSASIMLARSGARVTHSYEIVPQPAGADGTDTDEG